MNKSSSKSMNSKAELSSLVKSRLELLNIFSDHLLSQVLVYESGRDGFRWFSMVRVGNTIHKSSYLSKRIDAEIEAASAALSVLRSDDTAFDDEFLSLYNECFRHPELTERSDQVLDGSTNLLHVAEVFLQQERFRFTITSLTRAFNLSTLVAQENSAPVYSQPQPRNERTRTSEKSRVGSSRGLKSTTQATGPAGSITVVATDSLAG